MPDKTHDALNQMEEKDSVMKHRREALSGSLRTHVLSERAIIFRGRRRLENGRWHPVHMTKSLTFAGYQKNYWVFG